MSDRKVKLGRIEICRFTREENGPMEFGLLLNEGDLGILDRHGQMPSDIWTWWRSSAFALDIGSIFNMLQSYEMAHEAIEVKR